MIGKVHFKKILIGLSAILIGLMGTSIVNATEVASASNNSKLQVSAQGNPDRVTMGDQVADFFDIH